MLGNIIERNVPSVIVAISLVIQGIMVPGYSASVQVDPRRELERVKLEYERLVADQREYIDSTQQHMNRAIRHLLETVGFGYLKAAMGKETANITSDLYRVQRILEAGARGDTGEQIKQTISQVVSRIADRVGAGAATKIMDSLFDLLYLWQDSKQRQVLEKRLEQLNKLREYWSRYQKQRVGQRPSVLEESDESTLDGEFEESMFRMGIRVRTPGDAAKRGEAQITANAREGYARTDLHIVSKTDGYLALDFSSAYLIPSESNSDSQRIGLVSAANQKSSIQLNPRQEQQTLRFSAGFGDEGDLATGTIESQGVVYNHSYSFRQFVMAESAQRRQQSASKEAWSSRHWVIVGARAAITIAFLSVCLDHSRAIPGDGERFYLSDRPLPTRTQRILLAGSLNGEIPQSQVWDTIEAQNVQWYDPRGSAAKSPIQDNPQPSESETSQPFDRKVVTPTGRGMSMVSRTDAELKARDAAIVKARLECFYPYKLTDYVIANTNCSELQGGMWDCLAECRGTCQKDSVARTVVTGIARGFSTLSRVDAEAMAREFAITRAKTECFLPAKLVDFTIVRADCSQSQEAGRKRSTGSWSCFAEYKGFCQ